MSVFTLTKADFVYKTHVAKINMKFQLQKNFHNKNERNNIYITVMRNFGFCRQGYLRNYYTLLKKQCLICILHCLGYKI